MKYKNNKQQFYGLILIGLGILLLIIIGGPMLISLLALLLGLYMINYGLMLRGGPSLFAFLQKIIDDIRVRFFND